MRRLERNQDTSSTASRSISTPESLEEDEELVATIPSKRDRKLMRKAFKAIERDKVITAADVVHVKQVLYPQADAFDEAHDIAMNLAFHGATCNDKSVRFGLIERDTQISDSKEYDVELQRILAEFGVATNTDAATNSLMSDLVAAILHDLECHRNEMKSFARNRAGFWRWATSKALSLQIEHGGAWDAKPGAAPSVEKLKDRGDKNIGKLANLQITDTTTNLTRSHSSQSSPVIDPIALSVKENELKRSVSTSGAQAPTESMLTNPWTTQLRTKTGKSFPLGEGRIVRLSANNGLHHLRVKPDPKSWHDFVTSSHISSSSGEEYMHYDSDY
jgi:hypothetical protein